MPTVFITSKTDRLLDARQASLGLQRKEGFAHALLLLALTDDAFVSKAAELSKYVGDIGEQKLEAMGL